MKVPENCPSPLVGLEFDSDSSSKMVSIDEPKHIKINIYRNTPKHTKRDWRYGCLRMKSRSPPLASSFRHRLPSPCDMKTRHAPYSLAACKASRHARGGRGWSPVGMLTLARTLLTRRSQSLAARSVRSRSVASRNVNTCMYPTHSPLAEPRGSLGADAVGRQQRRSVRSRSVGRSLCGKQILRCSGKLRDLAMPCPRR